MGLLSSTDQQKLREALADMTRPVRLLFFTQTLGCETCLMTRQILDELPPLSDRISIEEVNLVLDADKAKQYGVDRAPAIAIVYEDADAPAGGEGAAPPALKDSHIRFVGAPSGYEFMALVQALRLAGGGESMLSDENRARVAAVSSPLTLQVFTTPT
jgi:alkyl hydroperoxide reductase subunit AhpF